MQRWQRGLGVVAKLLFKSKTTTRTCGRRTLKVGGDVLVAEYCKSGSSKLQVKWKCSTAWTNEL
jgi:hypothetical protein